MLNRIILIGRLTRDPEAKYTPSGVPVTQFSIAVDRIQSAEARQQGREKETDFIDIVTWRQTAEFAANYLGKGRLVAVEGKLQIRDYVTQDGQRRKAAEVVADNVRPLDRRPDAEGGAGAAQGSGGFDNGSQEPRYAANRVETPAPAAPRASYDRPAMNRSDSSAPTAPRAPAARNQPPAATGGDDYDDLTDPFAE